MDGYRQSNRRSEFMFGTSSPPPTHVLIDLQQPIMAVVTTGTEEQDQHDAAEVSGGEDSRSDQWSCRRYSLIDFGCLMG